MLLFSLSADDVQCELTGAAINRFASKTARLRAIAPSDKGIIAAP